MEDEAMDHETLRGNIAARIVPQQIGIQNLRSGCVNAVGRDFDFADAFERENEFYDIFRGSVGGLRRGFPDDVADGVGDCGVEQNGADLEAGEIYADHLAVGEHGDILARAKQHRRGYSVTRKSLRQTTESPNATSTR